MVVGYERESSNYRLYDPTTKKVVVSRNVIVHENVSPSGDEYEDREITLPSPKRKQNKEAAIEDAYREQKSPQEDPPGLQSRQLRDSFQANVAVYEIPNDYKEAVKGENKKE